jgi:hypothetical protein
VAGKPVRLLPRPTFLVSWEELLADLEADAIRRQATEAIRRANEAGSALLRSEDHPRPT